ncbi:hypothetical protein CSUI_007299 [Cystoisospora suis]|uniref:Uncharacterized protein n=1 Tax=Cystoisospora suis TaxID=483139 RepID=A0A2C6KQX4_9APIC|nr:hypothetical protein CSUI_007299 [Cystoisospora suis]
MTVPWWSFTPVRRHTRRGCLSSPFFLRFPCSLKIEVLHMETLLLLIVSLVYFFNCNTNGVEATRRIGHAWSSSISSLDPYVDRTISSFFSFPSLSSSQLSTSSVSSIPSLSSFCLLSQSPVPSPVWGLFTSRTSSLLSSSSCDSSAFSESRCSMQKPSLSPNDTNRTTDNRLGKPSDSRKTMSSSLLSFSHPVLSLSTISPMTHGHHNKRARRRPSSFLISFKPRGTAFSHISSNPSRHNTEVDKRRSQEEARERSSSLFSSQPLLLQANDQRHLLTPLFIVPKSQPSFLLITDVLEDDTRLPLFPISNIFTPPSPCSSPTFGYGRTRSRSRCRRRGRLTMMSGRGDTLLTDHPQNNLQFLLSSFSRLSPLSASPCSLSSIATASGSPCIPGRHSRLNMVWGYPLFGDDPEKLRRPKIDIAWERGLHRGTVAWEYETANRLAQGIYYIKEEHSIHTEEEEGLGSTDDMMITATQAAGNVEIDPEEVEKIKKVLPIVDRGDVRIMMIS